MNGMKWCFGVGSGDKPDKGTSLLSGQEFSNCKALRPDKRGVPLSALSGVRRENDEYLKLRELWCEVFGDEPEFVDSLYEDLEAEGYVGLLYEPCDDNCEAHSGGVSEKNDSGEADFGRIVTALTIYEAGEFEGQSVVVVYAVCTDPEYRGRGYASELIKAAVRDIEADGKLALTSPAEESLVGFYERLGFEGRLYAEEHKLVLDDEAGFKMEDFDEGDEFAAKAFDDNGKFVSPVQFSIVPIESDKYGALREEFLSNYPHIKLNKRMLDFIRRESYQGNGMLLINDGDAICVLAGREDCADAADAAEFADAADAAEFADSADAAEFTDAADSAEFADAADTAEFTDVADRADCADSGDSADVECMADACSGELQLMELLVNPKLEAKSSEIIEAIAAGLAELFGADEVRYRTKAEFAGVQSVGNGRNHDGCEDGGRSVVAGNEDGDCSVAAGNKDGDRSVVKIQSLSSGNEALAGAYFGFPLD